MKLHINLFLLFLITVGPLSLFSQKEDSVLIKKMHEFDFWIGDWSVYNYGTDKLVGLSKIEPIVDGLAIKESYHTPNGSYRGTSYNKYNQLKKRWEQFWVDNSGLTLFIKGHLREGRMILENDDLGPTGEIRNKITWTDLGDGTVRQEWEQLKQDTLGWIKIFDGHYKSNKINK